MTCSAGFECLTEDLGEILGLFNEVIQEPALPQDKLLLYKNQVCHHLDVLHNMSSRSPVAFGAGAVYILHAQAQALEHIACLQHVFR